MKKRQQVYGCLSLSLSFCIIYIYTILCVYIYIIINYIYICNYVYIYMCVCVFKMRHREQGDHRPLRGEIELHLSQGLRGVSQEGLGGDSCRVVLGEAH